MEFEGRTSMRVRFDSIADDYDRVARIERRLTADHDGAVRKEFLGTLAVSRRA